MGEYMGVDSPYSSKTNDYFYSLKNVTGITDHHKESAVHVWYLFCHSITIHLSTLIHILVCELTWLLKYAAFIIMIYEISI